MAVRGGSSYFRAGSIARLDSLWIVNAWEATRYDRAFDLTGLARKCFSPAKIDPVMRLIDARRVRVPHCHDMSTQRRAAPTMVADHDAYIAEAPPPAGSIACSARVRSA